jgi:diaminohydroxyphosphoribosylaminopyrimidine deaminase/5-amino-6-(5-phosphoribosylamino)uracil reductase
MDNHSKYMSRCLQLAVQGAGYVAPNPMVGAVLVYNNTIIGEGYHQQFGGPHAEVNCINSVKEEDRKFISHSTLYVSLEPCAHFGKTPPCSDLIIDKKIPKVVIGCRDPFKEVNGKGIEKLKSAGVHVELGIMEEECRDLNKRFFVFHTLHRPYIVLKWAETADKKIASPGADRLFISNEYSNRMVHKWRSEEASILVGTNTAMLDNPELNTRLWPGPSPVRMVVDMDLKLSTNLKLFDKSSRTIIFNKVKHNDEGQLQYYQVTEDVKLVHQIANALYQLRLNSVLVEGGAKLLQSFIDEELWDEIRVIQNEKLRIINGLDAPVFENGVMNSELRIENDLITTWYH